MKQILEKLYNNLGIKSFRTKNITQHLFISFFYKSGSILFSFLLVPLTINFLGSENYGIWLTLSSFISWFSFFDIGLGNGLRNKFAESKAKGDLSLAKAYVSTAYFTIGIVCLILIIIFFFLNFFIDWTLFYNTNPSLLKKLRLLMPIVFSFFCLQLVLKLIITIYTADQIHSIQGKFNFYSTGLTLIAIWFSTYFAKSSLLLFGTIFSVMPFFLLVLLNFYAFSHKFSQFKPSFILWKKKYLKDIFGLGIKFFIIQLSGIILFSTDNLIISQIYGPKEVVTFTIAFKYISISNMIFSMILAPYWSSITEAYTKADFIWIKKSINNLAKISFISLFFILLMVIFSPFVYKIWIGPNVTVPLSLTIYMALFFSLTIFYSPFTYFINATGKVKVQMYSIAVTSVINIPLSIFLAKNLNLGVSGVILATIICLIPHAIICPIQYLKIINNRAYGIWNN
jgi:O-antigen/teichoic acid export membrane protein